MRRNNHNILLQKDDVGMPKPTVRLLPNFGHSYGLPGARDTEGVKSCKYNKIHNDWAKNVFWMTNSFFVFSNYRVDSSSKQQVAKVWEQLQGHE